MLKIILILLIIFYTPNTVVASEPINVEDFTQEIQQYKDDAFPELYDSDWISDAIKGNIDLDGQDLFNKIIKTLFKEFIENKELLLKIIGISLLCSILKHLQNNFDGTISEIAFYVCYMLIIILIVTSFSNMIGVCINSISKLKSFMNTIIPILLTLLLALGNISSVASIQPILLLMISIITTIVSSIVIPIIISSTILGLVGNISQEIKVDKLSSFLKKSSMYILEMMMVIFIAILSMEGTLSAGVDGVTSKVTKTVISNAVPVVGKLLSDATDSILGSISITKNAVGIIGIVIIIVITSSAIIKSFLLMLMYNLMSSICETIADSRISKCLNIVADSTKFVFGLMVMVTILFIIAISLLIKISNFSLIYK